MMFRRVLSLLVLGGLVWSARPVVAQESPKRMTRFGYDANLEDYPQNTPKETLASVIAALEKKKLPYLLAQLVDPAWVDKRIKEVHGGDFDALVREITQKLVDEPGLSAHLARVLKQGEWEGAESKAAVKLKGVDFRQIFFRRVGSHWYMQNQQQEEKKP